MRCAPRMLALSAALMVLLPGCSQGSATPDAGPLDVGPPFDWTLEALPPESTGAARSEATRPTSSTG